MCSGHENKETRIHSHFLFVKVFSCGIRLIIFHFKLVPQSGMRLRLQHKFRETPLMGCKTKINAIF